MIVHDDVTKWTRSLLTNAIANQKIDLVDLNIICISATAYLSPGDRMVTDWVAHSQNKYGAVLQDPILKDHKDPSALIAAMKTVLPSGECTAELVYDNAKAREGLLVALQRAPKILCYETLNPTTGTDLITMDLPDPEPLIDGLLYPGTVAVIGALVKMHKTWLTLQLALDGISAADFLGHAVRNKLRVLYIGGEGSPHSVRKRLMVAVGYIPGLQDEDLDNLGIVSSQGRVKLDTQAGEEWLQRVSEGYDVVIVDPYYRFLSVGSENDHADQRAIQDVFDRLKSKGKAVVIVHHLRKPQGTDSGAAELRGAGLDAFADTILLLSRKKSGVDKRFNLKYILRHDEEPDDIELSLNGPLLQVAAPAPPAVTAEDLIAAITQAGGAASATDLKRIVKDATEAAKHEIDSAIVSALKEKKIGWRPKQGRGQGRMYFVR